MGEEGNTETRPWGNFTVLSNEADHKVKRIVVDPRKRFSLQRHLRRAEHWFMVKGEGLVTLGTEELSVKPGDAIDIPRGEMHRMSNPGTTGLCFIEVQTGDYFGEDDIERFEDDFGRGGE